MNRLSATTWIASIGLHGLLLLPLVGFAAAGPREIYDDGAGTDAFRLEQGITIDMVSFGDAAERVEIAEAAPMIANPVLPPVVETKPDDPDLKKVITAALSPTETVTAADDPPVEQPKPQDVAVQNQAAQVAMIAEKSAGQAQDGGKATALTAYVGKIHGALQKAKASVANGGTGQVTLGFTLDANGKIVERQVIKSSGVAALDKAAVDWLDRADFPPLPGLLGSGQRFNVPLTFKRKSG